LGQEYHHHELNHLEAAKAGHEQDLLSKNGDEKDTKDELAYKILNGGKDKIFLD